MKCFWSWCVAAAFIGIGPSAMGAATPVFFDSFDATAASFNLSSEAGAPRQGGPLVPVTYSQNASDYHHQLLGGVAPLLLAGDGFPPAPGQTMASPNYNFVGAVSGGILGKCITLTMDVGSLVQGNPASYVTGGVTVGASSALTLDDAVASHFGVRFVEDNFSGFGNFMQAFDGNVIVGNLISHPAGAGPIDLRLDINDLVDGNPWDGVGSTTIDVTVNGSPVFSFTKGGGGYTSNYLTLMGTPNFNGFGLATHTFDNLTVYAAPIPEPSSLAILAAAVAALSAVRRRVFA